MGTSTFHLDIALEILDDTARNRYNFVPGSIAVEDKLSLPQLYDRIQYVDEIGMLSPIHETCAKSSSFASFFRIEAVRLVTKLGFAQIEGGFDTGGQTSHMKNLEESFYCVLVLHVYSEEDVDAA